MTDIKKQKKEIKVVKYEYTSNDPARFSIGETDYNLTKGSKVELPENNPYVESLEAQGFLTRIK